MPGFVVRMMGLVLLLFLMGCASKAEERLVRLEAALDDLRMQEARLTLVEERVSRLGEELPATPSPEPGQPGRPGPSGVTKQTVAKPSSGAAGAPTAKPSTPPGGAKEPRPSASSAAATAYQKALSTLEAGRAEQAALLFNAFLEKYSDSPLIPNARYWLGECEYSRKRYDKAILAFRDVISQYPKHPKAAAAMLKAGYAYDRLGDKDNARFYLETLLQDYPSSEPAALARKKLAAL